MQTAVATFRHLPRARQAAALGVGVAVLLGHAWILQEGSRRAGPGAPDRAAGVQLRQIVLAVSPRPAVLAVDLPAAPAAPFSAPALRAPARPQPQPQPLPDAVAPALTRSLAQASAQVSLASSLDTSLPADRPVPTYATVLPPAVSLHYRVQRGERLGQAELQWAPDAQGYRLSLADDLAPKGVTGRSSRGRLTEHGLAPERFAELRRERELRAANFAPEAGRVSFSSTPQAHAWPAGGQDRLSWLIQLAAVVQAVPERFGAGQRIELPVVGTRGEPEVWAFEVLGREAVVLGEGAPQPLLALVRQPTRLYDARVQVWLDPQQHHLPVRLRFSPVPRGEVMELTLQPAGATHSSAPP